MIMFMMHNRPLLWNMYHSTCGCENIDVTTDRVRTQRLWLSLHRVSLSGCKTPALRWLIAWRRLITLMCWTASICHLMNTIKNQPLVFYLNMELHLIQRLLRCFMYRSSTDLLSSSDLSFFYVLLPGGSREAHTHKYRDESTYTLIQQ